MIRQGLKCISWYSNTPICSNSGGTCPRVGSSFNLIDFFGSFVSSFSRTVSPQKTQQCHFLSGLTLTGHAFLMSLQPTFTAEWQYHCSPDHVNSKKLIWKGAFWMRGDRTSCGEGVERPNLIYCYLYLYIEFRQYILWYVLSETDSDDYPGMEAVTYSERMKN